jgi:hypothetical protein
MISVLTPSPIRRIDVIDNILEWPTKAAEHGSGC